jgi:hypothetical protein
MSLAPGYMVKRFAVSHVQRAPGLFVAHRLTVKPFPKERVLFCKAVVSSKRLAGIRVDRVFFKEAARSEEEKGGERESADC